MNNTTIHLTVVIDDTDKTTYTVTRKLNPVQLAYLQEVVGVIDAIIFTSRQRDMVLGGTNTIIKDEIEFRNKLKEFLR